MRLEKWEKFFRNHLPFGSLSVNLQTAEEERLPYRVVALCRSANVNHVEQLIRHQISQGSAIHIYQGVLVGEGNLMRITLEIRCTIQERAEVVRLVTRLGLEKSVRSVRWESIPKKLAA